MSIRVIAMNPDAAEAIVAITERIVVAIADLRDDQRFMHADPAAATCRLRLRVQRLEEAVERVATTTAEGAPWVELLDAVVAMATAVYGVVVAARHANSHLSDGTTCEFNPKVGGGPGQWAS